MRTKRALFRHLTALVLALCLLPTPAYAADWNCWAFTMRIYPKASSAEKTAALLASNPSLLVSGIVGKQDSMDSVGLKPYRVDGKGYIEIVMPALVNMGVYAQHMVTLSNPDNKALVCHMFGRTVFAAMANTQIAGVTAEAVLGNILPYGIMDTNVEWLTVASPLSWNLNYATITLHPPVDENGNPKGEVTYLFAPYQMKGDYTYNFNDAPFASNVLTGYNFPKIPDGTYEMIDYHVDGWTESDTYSGEEYAYGGKFINSDVDLYPILKYVEPFQISFDLNDASDGNGSTEAVCDGKDSIPPRKAHYFATYADTNGDGTNDAELPIPQRPGYDFAGWRYTSYKTINGQQVPDHDEIVDNNTHVWATKNTTLVAQWTPHTYTIDLDANSGVFDGNACRQTEVSFDQELPNIGAIEGYSMPTKEGETLKGYFSKQDPDDSGTQYYNNAGSAATEKTRWHEVLGKPPWGTNGAKGTLYAQWKAQENTLTLDDQQGSGGQGSVTVEYNRKMPVLSKTPTKTGFSFDGYFTGVGGTGTKYYNADRTPAVDKWNIQNNITLYAKWVPGRTNVTLDPAGGSQPDSTAFTATYGSMIPNVKPPTRTGYDFGGYWGADNVQYINPSGTGIQTWYRTEGTYTLTAEWTPHTTSVALNAMGAETAGTDSFQATYDQKPGNIGRLPQKIGADFGGYYTKNGSVTNDWGERLFDETGAFQPAAWTIDQPTATLYAKWVKKGYELTLNTNAGGDPVNNNGSLNHTLYYNEYYPTLPAPTRTGYDFTGWYKSKTAADQSDVSALVQSVNIVPQSVVNDGGQTLFAGWKAKVVNVTYRILEGIEQTKPIEYGQKYGEPVSFSLPGQDLEGWYDNAQFTGSKIIASTLMKREDDHTLYPKFVGKNVTVSFDKGVGNLSPTDQRLKNITVHYNGPYGKLPALTTDKDGRVFAGWFLESSFNTEITAESIVENEYAHTLYAKWVEGRLTISFNSNGGSACPTRQVEKGDTYGENGKLPAPTREGYTFDGWYRNSNLTVKVEGTTVNNNAGSESITLYAKWAPNDVRVTFKTNVPASGNGWSGASMAKTGKYNTTTYGGLWGGDLPTLTAANYKFNGWYTEAGWKVESTQKINELAEHTLLAGWTDTRATVVLNDSGGTMSSKFQVVNLMARNTPFTLPQEADMTREGYTFLGWSTEGGGSTLGDVKYAGGAEYRPQAESTVYVLYAVWEQKQGHYQTKHYLQNLDGSYTEQVTDSLKTVPAGTQVVAQPKEYANYHINYGAEDTVSAATIEAEKTAKMHLYYDLDLRSAFVDTGGIWALETATGSIGVADSAGNPVQVRHGGTLAFTVTTSATGYNPKDVTVTVGDQPLQPDESGVYTIQSMTENKDVRISGEQTNLAVTPGQSGFRIVPAPAGPALAPYGSDFRFTLELDAPYSQSQLSVFANNTQLTPKDGIYTLKNVTVDQIITVTGLRFNQYRMTYGQGEGYVIQNEDSMTVAYGGSHRFQVMLEESYMGQTPVVRANGGAPLAPEEIDGLTYTYVVEPVLRDQHITVDPMERATYTIAYPKTAGQGYRVIPVAGMDNPVPHGGAFAFTLDLDAQYANASPAVTVTGASGTQTTILPIGGVYYVPDVKEDASIAVSRLTEQVCEVDIQQGVGYQVATMAESNKVGYGGYYLFGIQPDAAYSLQEPVVKVNGAITQPYSSMELEGNVIYSYFLTDIIQDTTVTIAPMEKNRFTVKWVVEDVPRIELCELDTIPSYGQTPVKPSTAQASYRFTGWQDDGGNFYPAGATLPRVTKNVTYTAQFEQTERSVAVNWVVDGQIHTDQYGFGATPVFAGATEKDADPGNTYTFTGWSDGTKTYAPGEPLPAVTGPASYTAQYSAQPREYTLTVRLRYAGNAQEETTLTEDYKVGADFSVTIPPVEHYTASQTEVSGVMPAQDHEITVIYFPDAEGTTYKVTHLLENLDDGGYTPAKTDTETLRGTAGATTAAAARSYPGFTPQPFEQTTIDGGGTTEVEIRYSRNSYALTWNPNGGLFQDFDGDLKQDSYRFGQTIPEEKRYTVNRASTDARSYAFSGWSSPVPDTMPAYDLTLTAQWTPQARTYQVTVEFVDKEGAEVAEPVSEIFAVGADYVFTDFPVVENMTPSRTTVTGVMPAKAVTEKVVYFAATDAANYTVEHYLADADGAYTAEPGESESRTGYVGQEVREGAKTIEGYVLDRIEPATVTADGEAKVKVYYTRREYTVTFDLDGGTLVSGSASVTGAWGAPLAAPTVAKANATFKAWSPALPDTIPMGGGSYTATWNSGGGGSGGSSGSSGGGDSSKPEPDLTPKGDYPAFVPCDRDHCTTEHHFADNPKDVWYHDFVDYAYANELMLGLADDTFGPGQPLTRSMLVTILYRMADAPATSGVPMFGDVDADAWYIDPLLWATQNSIVSGYGDDRFGPDDHITREQAAAILHRFAVHMGYPTADAGSLDRFSDAEEVGGWAQAAMRWAVGAEILSGNADGTLAPKGTATRAEVAALLSRYCAYISR